MSRRTGFADRKESFIARCWQRELGAEIQTAHPLQTVGHDDWILCFPASLRSVCCGRVRIEDMHVGRHRVGSVPVRRLPGIDPSGLHNNDWLFNGSVRSTHSRFTVRLHNGNLHDRDIDILCSGLHNKQLAAAGAHADLLHGRQSRSIDSAIHYDRRSVSAAVPRIGVGTHHLRTVPQQFRGDQTVSDHGCIYGQLERVCLLRHRVSSQRGLHLLFAAGDEGQNAGADHGTLSETREERTVERKSEDVVHTRSAVE